MRADGTATSAALATGCSSPATAINVSEHNRQRFDPGDTIVLCSEGGEFRDRVVVQSDGAAEAPITYDGRGTAVLSGSDVVQGWRQVGSSLYASDLADEPRQLFIDGEFGDRKATRQELADDLDWTWADGTVYLRSGAGDPDLVYLQPGVEASIRTFCFDLAGHGYIVVSGLVARHSNSNGIGGWNPGSHTVIARNVVEWNWHNGIGLNGRVPYRKILIEGNTARYNGTGGIGLLGPAINSTIRGNRCFGNGKHQSAGNEYDYQHRWTYGIKLWESDSYQEGNHVYENEVFDNGRGEPGDFQGRGTGIWIDMVRGKSTNPIVIRHNTVHDNRGNGIFIEISSNTVTYGNLLVDNATNRGGRGVFAPANIVVDAREDWVTEGNLVINNTAVGGRNGIKVVTYEQQAGCSVRNNTIANNIVHGAEEHSLYCDTGGDNDGTNGSGNLYTHNNFGPESDDFILWGGTRYDTYAGWESEYGQTTRSVNGDPGFEDVAGRRFNLAESSPCRDAGANLGPVYGRGLVEGTVWPDRVITEDHDLHGDGWEVGAYVYVTGHRARSIPPSGRRWPEGGGVKDP